MRVAAPSHLAFATRFGLLIGERGLAAINILANSIVVARLLDAHAAATYFFITSLAQLAMSPWVPGGEVTWLREKRDPTYLGQLVATAFTYAALSGCVVAVAGLLYIRTHQGFPPILLACLTANVAYPAILRLLPSKFGATSRFVATTTIAGVVALGIKFVALAAHAPPKLAAVALFIDMLALPLAAMLSTTSPLSIAGARLLPKSCQVQLFTAAASVLVSLVSSRLIMLVSGTRLPAAEYATFGLAFQVLNATSFIAAALTGSAASMLRGAEHVRDVLKGVTTAALAAAGLAAGGFAALLIAGRPVLEVLLGGRGAATYSLVLAGFPFVLSALLQGVSMAVGATQGRISIFAGMALLTAGVSTAAFTLTPGALTDRVLSWALVHLLINISCLLYITRISTTTERSDQT